VNGDVLSFLDVRRQRQQDDLLDLRLEAARGDNEAREQDARLGGLTAKAEAQAAEREALLAEREALVTEEEDA
jgi:hypothetical protein